MRATIQRLSEILRAKNDAKTATHVLTVAATYPGRPVRQMAFVPRNEPMLAPPAEGSTTTSGEATYDNLKDWRRQLRRVDFVLSSSSSPSSATAPLQLGMMKNPETEAALVVPLDELMRYAVPYAGSSVEGRIQQLLLGPHMLVRGLCQRVTYGAARRLTYARIILTKQPQQRPNNTGGNGSSSSSSSTMQPTAAAEEARIEAEAMRFARQFSDAVACCTFITVDPQPPIHDVAHADAASIAASLRRALQRTGTTTPGLNFARLVDTTEWSTARDAMLFALAHPAAARAFAAFDAERALASAEATARVSSAEGAAAVMAADGCSSVFDAESACLRFICNPLALGLEQTPTNLLASGLAAMLSGGSAQLAIYDALVASPGMAALAHGWRALRADEAPVLRVRTDADYTRRSMYELLLCKVIAPAVLRVVGPTCCTPLQRAILRYASAGPAATIASVVLTLARAGSPHIAIAPGVRLAGFSSSPDASPSLSSSSESAAIHQENSRLRKGRLTAQVALLHVSAAACATPGPAVDNSGVVVAALGPAQVSALMRTALALAGLVRAHLGFVDNDRGRGGSGGSPGATLIRAATGSVYQTLDDDVRWMLADVRTHSSSQQQPPGRAGGGSNGKAQRGNSGGSKATAAPPPLAGASTSLLQSTAAAGTAPVESVMRTERVLNAYRQAVVGPRPLAQIASTAHAAQTRRSNSKRSRRNKQHRQVPPAAASAPTADDDERRERLTLGGVPIVGVFVLAEALGWECVFPRAVAAALMRRYLRVVAEAQPAFCREVPVLTTAASLSAIRTDDRRRVGELFATAPARDRVLVDAGDCAFALVRNAAFTRFLQRDTKMFTSTTVNDVRRSHVGYERDADGDNADDDE